MNQSKTLCPDMITNLSVTVINM